MARYIDASELIRRIKIETNPKLGGTLGSCNRYPLLNMIDKMPTAEVAPKSEVERLQEEANRYKRNFFRHDYDEMIAEVLDKLDRFINANCIEIKDERGIKGYVTSGVHFAIAELKKKYTEDKHEKN